MRARRSKLSRTARCVGALFAAGCGTLYGYPGIEPENTAAKCSDGKDNDLNGKTDCEDPRCVGFCPEESAVACSDGLDNDGDGLIDAADPTCWHVAPPQVRRCAEARGVEIVENFDEGPQWNYPGSPWHHTGSYGLGLDIAFSFRHRRLRPDGAVGFQGNTAALPIPAVAYLGTLVRQWAFSGTWKGFDLSFSASVSARSVLVAGIVPIDLAPALERPAPGAERALFSLTLAGAAAPPVLILDVEGADVSASLPLPEAPDDLSDVRVVLDDQGFLATLTQPNGQKTELRAPGPSSLALPPSRLAFWGGSGGMQVAELDDVRLRVGPDRPCGIAEPQIPGPTCVFVDKLRDFGQVVSVAQGKGAEQCALVTGGSLLVAPSAPPTARGPQALTAWKSVDGQTWAPASSPPDAPPVELPPGAPLVGAGIAHDDDGWHVAVAYRGTEEVRLGFAFGPTCGAWGALKPGPTLFKDAGPPSYVIENAHRYVYFARPPSAQTHHGAALWRTAVEEPDSTLRAPEWLAELPLDTGGNPNLAPSVQRIGARDLVLTYPISPGSGHGGVALLVGDQDGRVWKSVDPSPSLALPRTSAVTETGEGRLAFDSFGIGSAALSWSTRGGFLMYGGESVFGLSGTTIDGRLSAGTAQMAPAGQPFPQPTTAPEGTCGDGTCDAREQCTSCPADCPCDGVLLLADALTKARAWTVASRDPSPAAVQYLDPARGALNWAGSTALDTMGQPILRPPPTWSVLPLDHAIVGDFELSFDLVVAWIDPHGSGIPTPIPALWCSTYIGLGTVPDLVVHPAATQPAQPTGVFARVGSSGVCLGKYAASPFVQSSDGSFGTPKENLADSAFAACPTEEYVPTETRRHVLLKRDGSTVTVAVERGDGCGMTEKTVTYSGALPELPALVVGFGTGDGSRDPASGFAACLATSGAGTITNLRLRLFDEPTHCPSPKQPCGAGSEQPTCVDTDRSLEHCGACGHPCGAKEVCTRGTCASK